ncbi:hypothetical protein [Kribbella monticola]|uniref:hypothetical protein n=1 Tax=Kribbella monticola TaxID=2185285 RepID=UPI000DD2B7EB|nr:hypothetical protein [Kribbella monticola]
MSQFELETRHSFHSPGGTLALAMHRCAAYATAVGLLVLLGADWLERTVTGSWPVGSIDSQDVQWTGLELFDHDKHALSSIALVLYLGALVGAIGRPAQRGTSMIASLAGLAATVLLLAVAPQDRVADQVVYRDHWLPAPFIALALWIALTAITGHAWRVSRS